MTMDGQLRRIGTERTSRGGYTRLREPVASVATDSVPVPVLEAHRPFALNAAGERITGYSREEFVGAPFGLLTGIDALEAAQQAFAAGTSSGRREIRRKDGTLIEVDDVACRAQLGPLSAMATVFWPPS
jgi:PAS domain-containing protein